MIVLFGMAVSQRRFITSNKIVLVFGGTEMFALLVVAYQQVSQNYWQN